jgi:hypothetical protein
MQGIFCREGLAKDWLLRQRYERDHCFDQILSRRFDSSPPDQLEIDLPLGETTSVHMFGLAIFPHTNNAAVMIGFLRLRLLDANDFLYSNTSRIPFD